MKIEEIGNSVIIDRKDFDKKCRCGDCVLFLEHYPELEKLAVTIRADGKQHVLIAETLCEFEEKKSKR